MPSSWTIPPPKGTQMLESYSAEEKQAARYAANAAVKSGELAPQPCEDCGETESVEMHHDDYGLPLKVRFLCQPCHRRLHPYQRRTAKAQPCSALAPRSRKIPQDARTAPRVPSEHQALALDLLAGETSAEQKIMMTPLMKVELSRAMGRRKIPVSQYIRHLIAPKLAEMVAEDAETGGADA